MENWGLNKAHGAAVHEEEKPQSQCTEEKWSGPEGGGRERANCFFASTGFALKLLMYVQSV